MPRPTFRSRRRARPKLRASTVAAAASIPRATAIGRRTAAALISEWRFLTVGVSLDSTSTRKRPLSPFLTVYRWQYTMALSILHRVTGCALSVGLLLFVYWLVAAASGRDGVRKPPAVSSRIRSCASLLIGFSFAFFYHLLNGVRHLTWDTGHGLERKAARLSGWIVFLGAIATTALFWLLVLRHGGGAA